MLGRRSPTDRNGHWLDIVIAEEDVGDEADEVGHVDANTNARTFSGAPGDQRSQELKSYNHQDLLNGQK